jgi:hypothetical protein
MAKPTFESIKEPKPRLGERVKRESFWAEGLGLKPGKKTRWFWILAEDGPLSQENC